MALGKAKFEADGLFDEMLKSAVNFYNSDLPEQSTSPVVDIDPLRSARRMKSSLIPAGIVRYSYSFECIF